MIFAQRIKLLCKSDVTINAGKIQVVNTSCIIKEKSCKNSVKTLQKLSMYMLPYESLSRLLNLLVTLIASSQED